MITPTEERVGSAMHGVPLHLKLLMALLIASIAPITLALVFDTKLAAGAESLRVFIEFLSTSIQIGSYSLRLYTIFVLSVFTASIVAALIYMEFAFVQPIRELTKWVEATRNTSFENVPVMPASHSRDISRLGRGIAAALAYSVRTKNQNVSLSSKKDELVVIAAHQLRTPLTGLKWAVQSLPAQSTPESTARVEEIQTTVQRIALIVDSIVASADIEEGRLRFTFSDVDAKELVQKALADLALTIKQRDLTVTCNFPDAAKPVRIDVYRMSTAIYNVIENAVEYTPQKGTVVITLADQGTALELSIQDTGIGIPASETPYLFTKFFRGESAKHMRPNGSGLGLYLAKHVVEAHGQKIWLESTEGKGTKVTIPLPYEAPKD